MSVIVVTALLAALCSIAEIYFCRFSYRERIEDHLPQAGQVQTVDSTVTGDIGVGILLGI